MTDIVTRLRAYNIGNIAHEASSHMEETLYEAADEIERLRELAKALYEETKRCGSKHDVKATNDWEEYDEAVRGE